MSRINIEGKIGNGELVGNAAVVEIRESLNGSGDDAFGGANSWPSVRAEVEFQTGEERRALDFARKLTELIKSEFASSTTTGREG